MKKETLVRALRDADYRDSLSAEERAHLPAHPAGAVELSDADLANLAGACNTNEISHCISYCESCWTGGSSCCC